MLLTISFANYFFCSDQLKFSGILIISFLVFPAIKSLSSHCCYLLFLIDLINLLFFVCNASKAFTFINRIVILIFFYHLLLFKLAFFLGIVIKIDGPFSLILFFIHNCTPVRSIFFLVAIFNQLNFLVISIYHSWVIRPPFSISLLIHLDLSSLFLNFISHLQLSLIMILFSLFLGSIIIPFSLKMQSVIHNFLFFLRTFS